MRPADGMEPPLRRDDALFVPEAEENEEPVFVQEEAPPPVWEEEAPPAREEEPTRDRIEETPPVRQEAPTASPAAAAAAPAETVPAALFDWKALCERMAPRLPNDLRYSMDDSVIRGTLTGNILQLQVQPGFKYGRFNRQEILESFAEEASALVGREIRVQIGELREEERPQRSLDELKAFKEVHFN
jgi:hypothetical protein